MEGRVTKVVVRILSVFVMFFLYAPLFIVVIYAFNKATDQAWPPELWSTRWFGTAWADPEVRTALLNSVLAALGASAIALVLGSLAAFAVHRFRFFGRESLSFILVLPIALPGIVTALALSSGMDYAQRSFGLQFGLTTIIIGHATFCVVVVYNNVVARLRRTPTSLVEASMDLGADGWQTFRYVTFPSIRTALVAGGLLAFGLSFDEIVVTNFTAGTTLTLPVWIFNHIRLPTDQPVVNVVAMAVMLLSLVPIFFAQRLAGATDLATTGTKGVKIEEAGPG